jgi:hypothetical protein
MFTVRPAKLAHALRYMKKSNLGLLAFSTVFAIAGCGDDNDSGGGAPGDNNVVTMIAYANDFPSDIYALMDISPGQRIDVEPAVESTTKRIVKLPAGFAGSSPASETTVEVWCDGLSSRSLSHNGDNFDVYPPCKTPAVVAVAQEQGIATKLIIVASATMDAAGSYDLSAQSLRPVKDVVVPIKMIPAGVEVAAFLLSKVADCAVNVSPLSIVNASSAAPVANAKVVDLDGAKGIFAGMLLTKPSGRLGQMQVVATLLENAPYSMEISPLVLPWVESESFAAATRKLTFETTVGGAAPDAHIVYSHGGQPVNWYVTAPANGNQLTLPALPFTNPLQIQATDNVIAKGLRLLRFTGVGYDVLKSGYRKGFDSLQRLLSDGDVSISIAKED